MADDLTERIIGAAIEVYHVMNFGQVRRIDGVKRTSL